MFFIFLHPPLILRTLRPSFLDLSFLEPDPVAIVLLRGVEGDLLAAHRDDLASGALLQCLLARVSQRGHLG